ncbi:MAG: bifunctional oligoribonuclease/PAP phosphatase NrnA [Bdellovibrionales bacterium]|nr:bifunctional oligoribonuclease/PAP phosphatase NrnA [Bdellovibrionales bacterium]
MIDLSTFADEIKKLESALNEAETILLTAPGVADGDSIGAQLALRRMLKHCYPKAEVRIVNDEPIQDRYLFLPDIQYVETPETFWASNPVGHFDLGIIVDGGVDRAGRVREIYEKCKKTAFIDHHVVSVQFRYDIRIVEPTACSTTELVYHLSQLPAFITPLSKEFCQQVYLGLIFDTGFFRHSNTTPEAMELGAKLLRTGFDFTRVGERGMLERTFNSLKLLSYTLARAQLRAEGKIIWSTVTQDTLRSFKATDDDREGIIDHLFLTHGIEVAVLFYEMPENKTRLSFRSQGAIDVARFARSLTEHGGGHEKASGAMLDIPMSEAVEWVLERLEAAFESGLFNASKKKKR